MHNIFLSLYFDEATEQAVREVWGKIAAAGVRVDGLGGHRPHITLAAYETERPGAYASWVEEFVQTQVRLPLRLQSPAIFFETNTVYLAPRLSGVWFEMHTQLLTHLHAQGADPQRFAHHIDIGTWTPHCTLVSRVEPQEVLTVVKIAQQAWRIRDGFAEGIGVVVLPEPLDRSKHRFASPQTAAAYTIRPARLGELEFIQVVEQAAGQRFAAVGLDIIAAMDPIAQDVLAQHQLNGQLWVAVTAADEIAGFLMMAVVDGEAYLEELSVHPDHGRRGLGQRLLTYGCQWAQAQGYKSVALSTFADVAWNAPFYARLGFEILPQEVLTAALLAIQAEETAAGLDIRPRVFMRKTLDAIG